MIEPAGNDPGRHLALVAAVLSASQRAVIPRSWPPDRPHPPVPLPTPEFDAVLQWATPTVKPSFGFPRAEGAALEPLRVPNVERLKKSPGCRCSRAPGLMAPCFTFAGLTSPHERPRC